MESMKDHSKINSLLEEILNQKGTSMDFTGADGAYHRLITEIMEFGTEVRTRNSNCKRIFAYTQIFRETPLISTRKTAWRNSLREWEWFMSGSDRLEDLHPAVQKWWRPWVSENGFIDYNYSRQFRHSSSSDIGNVDAIDLLIKGIKHHPFSRRNVISTWNTAEMNHELCKLTNCHGTVIQAFVEAENDLHLVTYQRSSDVICGLGSNWFQYWAFLLWLAHRTGRQVGSLTWIGGDIHIYQAHYDLAQKILKNFSPGPTPQLVYKPTSEDFLAEDFSLDRAYEPILLDKAEMIV